MTAYATLKQDISAFDYTATGTVTAGDLIFNGNDLLGIAKLDIASGAVGALHAQGIFDIAKKTSVDTFSLWSKVYWDTTNAWATPTPTSKFLGICVSAAAATDTTVRTLVLPQLADKPVLCVASKAITIATMTDNTNTTGYIDFATGAIPAFSFFVGWKIVTTTGFTGDTTAVAIIGISGDTDAYSETTTGSVLAAGTIGCGTPATGINRFNAAAVTPRVTITGGADFTSISAGAATAYFYYIPMLSTNLT
jgi:predicted RecA/RadA family phage recombinase